MLLRCVSIGELPGKVNAVMENLEGDCSGRKYASPRCGELQRLPGERLLRRFADFMPFENHV